MPKATKKETHHELKSRAGNLDPSGAIRDTKRHYSDVMEFMDGTFDLLATDNAYIPGVVSARKYIRMAYQFFIRLSTGLFSLASGLILVSVFVPPLVPIVMGVVVVSLGLFVASAAVLVVSILLMNTCAAIYELNHLRDFMLLDKAKKVNEGLMAAKSQLELIFFDQLDNGNINENIDALKYSDNKRLVKLSFLYDTINRSLKDWPKTVSNNSFDKSKSKYTHDLSRSKQWLVGFEEDLITSVAEADMDILQPFSAQSAGVLNRIEPELSAGVYVHEALSRLPLINVVYRLVTTPLRMLGIVSKGDKLYPDVSVKGEDHLSFDAVRSVLHSDHGQVYPYSVYDYWLARINEKIAVIDFDDRELIDGLRNAAVKQGEVLDACSKLMNKCGPSSPLYNRLESLQRVLKSYVGLNSEKLSKVSVELDKCEKLSSKKSRDGVEIDLLRLSCDLLGDDCNTLAKGGGETAYRVDSGLDVQALQESFEALQQRRDKVVTENNIKIQLLKKEKPFTEVLSILKPPKPKR